MFIRHYRLLIFDLIVFDFVFRYLKMKLHTIESMEKKVKSNELKLDSNQQAKVSKKKEIQNTIKAVEYSLKQGSKGAGR